MSIRAWRLFGLCEKPSAEKQAAKETVCHLRACGSTSSDDAPFANCRSRSPIAEGHKIPGSDSGPDDYQTSL